MNVIFLAPQIVPYWTGTFAGPHRLGTIARTLSSPDAEVGDILVTEHRLYTFKVTNVTQLAIHIEDMTTTTSVKLISVTKYQEAKRTYELQQGQLRRRRLDLAQILDTMSAVPPHLTAAKTEAWLIIALGGSVPQIHEDTGFGFGITKNAENTELTLHLNLKYPIGMTTAQLELRRNKAATKIINQVLEEREVAGSAPAKATTPRARGVVVVDTPELWEEYDLKDDGTIDDLTQANGVSLWHSALNRVEELKNELADELATELIDDLTRDAVIARWRNFQSRLETLAATLAKERKTLQGAPERE